VPKPLPRERQQALALLSDPVLLLVLMLP